MSKIFLLLFMIAFCSVVQAQEIRGAWKRDLDTAVQYMTLVDDYFTVSTFHVGNKNFIRTRGGTARFNGASLEGIIEFNSSDRAEVKKSYSHPAAIKGKKLDFDVEGITTDWVRVDKAQGALSGNWAITGREQNGQMGVIKPGARKTLKMMSETRFQWIAINSETGEFSGTGGGTYTFNNGVYTENIEFFSRDASRVGASLAFQGELIKGNWHHKGKSSKGEPIYEIWSRKW